MIAKLLRERHKLRPISERRRSRRTAWVSHDAKWICLQRIWNRPERFDTRRDQKSFKNKHRRCSLVENQWNDENLDFAV